MLNLRNASTAFTVFDFAVGVGDYGMAWNMLGQLETTLSEQADAGMLKRARTYRLAHAALARGDLDQADALFETALGGGVAGDRDVLILTLLRKRADLTKQGDSVAAKDVEVTLARLVVPSAAAP